VFDWHAAHRPRTQNGEPAPQSPADTHSTHPRALSHFLLPHAAATSVVQAIPEPPEEPMLELPELPPHATTIPKANETPRK
jgi:hypothetical protein